MARRSSRCGSPPRARKPASNRSAVGGAGPRAPSVNAYINPYTGEVLGGIRSDEDQLAGFFNFTLRLHRQLFIGSTGRVITELATGWTIILIGTGVYLWWPKNRSKTRGVWLPRWSAKGYTFPRDLHAVVGAYFVPIAATIAVTGMFYTYAVGTVIHDVAHHVMEDEETPAVAKTQTAEKSQSAATGDAKEVRADHGETAPEKQTAPELPLDDAIAVLRREYPDRIYFATLGKPQPGRGGMAPANEPPGMRVSAGTDFNASYGPFYSTQMILKPENGEVVSRKHLSDGGHFWHAWTYPLHVGSILGPTTKVLWFLACVVLTGLPITGVWMWWKRRPTGTLGLPRKPDRKIPWWMYAGILTLCVLMPIVGASIVLILLGERTYRFALRRRRIAATV
ncbi:MAG: PepSY domain-containing protein [Pirellulales bacterium]